MAKIVTTPRPATGTVHTKPAAAPVGTHAPSKPAHAPASNAPGKPRTDVFQTAAVPTADLDALTSPSAIINAGYAEFQRHSPVLALYRSPPDLSVGSHLDDLSQKEFSTYKARLDVLARKLGTIDPAALTPSERFGFGVLQGSVKQALASINAGARTWEMSTEIDPILDPEYTFSSITVANQADFDALKARYSKELPRFLNQRMSNLEEGARNGLTSNKSVVEAMATKCSDELGLPFDDENSPFHSVQFADTVSDADKAKWTAEFKQVIDTVTAPAYRTFGQQLTERIVPNARTSFGYGGLGQTGKAYYQAQVEYQTGADTSAEALHALGLKRVEEVGVQLNATLDALGIAPGPLQTRLKALDALPVMQPASREDIERLAPKMVEYLQTSPLGHDLGLEGLRAPKYKVSDTASGAKYVSGSGTMRLPAKGQSLARIAPTVLHESAHNFQDAVQQELTPFSTLQPILVGSLLSEGGAHNVELRAAADPTFYPKLAESLGVPNPKETGLAMQASALNSLMMRATRLVVDTGIHSKGWSRDEALSYFEEHVSMSPDAAQSEVDRYASYPAQALSYRVGAELIEDAEQRARTTLGVKFDAPAFNQMILGLAGADGSALKEATDAFIQQRSR